MKKKYVKTIIFDLDMDTAKKKRIERKKKLKRVFNFDAETKFLDSFWYMKKNKLTVDQFNELVKKTLVDTEQVSDVVLEYYIEQLKTKLIIKNKTDERQKYLNKAATLAKDIRDLEESLKDEEEPKPTYGRFSSDC